MFLVADLLVTLGLLSLGWRNDKFTGGWIWVLAIPLVGKLSFLRFDMVPTAFAVIALTLPESRWKSQIFGVVMGLGAAVKAWPAVAFIAVSQRKDAKIVILSAGLTALLVVGGTLCWCSGSLDFLRHQTGRGLQIEAVGATPWYIWQAVSGHAVKWGPANGTLEILGAWPDTVAACLHVMMLTVGCACALWWVLWTQQSASECADIRSAIGRDAAFTAILLYVVVSPVLSPQYLIWLIGLGAVAASSPHSVVRRAVWAVVVATLLTQALLTVWGELLNGGPTGAYFVAERNLVLLFAGVDAAIALFKVVKMPALVPDAVNSKRDIPIRSKYK
jgi:hypothetical protein